MKILLGLILLFLVLVFLRLGEPEQGKQIVINPEIFLSLGKEMFIASWYIFLILFVSGIISLLVKRIKPSK